MIFPFPIFPFGKPLTITEYTTTPTDLVNTVVKTGITLVGTPVLEGASGQVAFFDGGKQIGLSTDKGILLTTGDGTPELENTGSGAGVDTEGAGNAQLDAMLATAAALGVTGFEGQTTNDAVALTFSFTATGGNAVKFDLVFGSEEFPEFADQFPDVAGVFVDGVNFAFFAGPTTPLSVLQSNIDAGYFIDNQGAEVEALEYDGLSHGLTIIAPLDPALSVHTITIAIADTGDHILDSGMFINNFTVENATQGGVKQIIPATIGDDIIVGGPQAEYAELDTGNDSMLGGAGDDLIKGGADNDTIRAGEGLDQVSGQGGNDLILGNLGNDTLRGGAGDDVLGGSKDNDEVRGGAGADAVRGGAGSDRLFGGPGLDTVTGGQGDDTVTGGLDGDTFLFSDLSGDDQITDFTPVDDTIMVKSGVNGTGLTTPTALYNALSDDGSGNTVLDLGTESVLILGVTKAAMTIDDFVVF